jgi:hypothetical protein
VRITDVTAVVELLKSSSIDYQRAYAHLLLENYGVPARIVPNATDKDMQSYGLSDEMIAYIKANGRCEEDKIRFI